MIKIMAGAQDPGGAEALAPVLSALNATNDVRLEMLARTQAAAVFCRFGLEFECADKLSDAAVTDRVFAAAPNLVIAATSQYGTLEQTLIAAARSRDIPTLAVLDSWTNYRVRFAKYGEEITDAFPDVIAVPDALAFDEMCAAGLPADRLSITGQPAFDKLAGRMAEDHSQIRKAIRTILDLQADEILVSFFSQPIRAMYGDPDGDMGRGYDEKKALDCLARALAALTQPVRLVVKPHPREQTGTFDEYLSRNAAIATLAHELDPDDLMLASDIVCGMTTIMLVRAWLAGRCVVSVQPGLRDNDALWLARAGHIKTAVDQQATVTRLNEALQTGPAAPPESNLTDGKATQRVTALALSMTGHHAAAVGK